MKIFGEIKLKGDKSISHRVLLLGSLIEGVSTVENISLNNDVLSTIECLRKCNIKITVNDAIVKIEGGTMLSPSDILNCGNSGTTARMLIGLLCGQNISAKLTGDESLSLRPMKRIISPLINSGAKILSNDNKLPIEIKQGIQTPILYEKNTKSSQVISSLLFAGIGYNKFSKILFNEFTRDHTELLFKYLKFDLKYKKNFLFVKKSNSVRKFRINIPGDISNACFLIVASFLIPNSKIKISNLLYNKKRNGFIDAALKMGGKISISNIQSHYNEHTCDIVSAYSPKLKSIKINGNDILPLIDEIPILSVLATQAKGTTIIDNAGELRFKECDRLAATYENLNAMDADVSQTVNGLKIKGRKKLYNASINHYKDHRIAMSFVILKLFITGKVDKSYKNIISVSFPEFYEILDQILL